MENLIFTIEDRESVSDIYEKYLTDNRFLNMVCDIFEQINSNGLPFFDDESFIFTDTHPTNDDGDYHYFGNDEIPAKYWYNNLLLKI